MEEPITYMNSKESCIVCFKEPEKWDNSSVDIELIKHHVSYYPQVIAFVHFKCHEKIHDPDHPLTQFIQYTREDSIKFYEQKKENENTIPKNWRKNERTKNSD